MKHLTIILLSLISFHANANDLLKLLSKSGFVQVSIPKNDELSKANHSTLEYCVEKHNNEFLIKNSSNCENKVETSIKIGDKKYIGSNKGEFGGELSLLHATGEYQILIKDNIVQIIKIDDSLYVFSGLSHLTVSRGAIYKITSPESKPKVERVTLLPDAPVTAIPIYSNNKIYKFIIVTSSGILSYVMSYELLEVNAIHEFWYLLYPNSAVINDKSILIGIRSGLVLIKTGYKTVKDIKYYVKNETNKALNSQPPAA